MKKVKLMLGDNMLSLKKLPDNSVDSIVSDPPYGLSFMGKKWDYDVPSVEFWKEVWRVLKPGGHVLSFGGTRTYHRMVVNIEDAGFEIRDQVMWLYGSGFPKSHNIGKAVDKIEGNERVEWLDEKKTQPNIRGGGNLGGGVVGEKGSFDREPIKYSKGQSPYEGWGTALKPANEPICVARKPLSEKTIAENVIKWGTGGINIDGCRVATDDKLGREFKVGGQTLGAGQYGLNDGRKTKPTNNLEGTYHDDTKGLGRFPANIILDETAAELLDEQSGISKSSKSIVKGGFDSKVNTYVGGGGIIESERGHNDKGGASRFFYVAKVSKKERNLGLDGFEEKEVEHNRSMRCDNCGLWILSNNSPSCKCEVKKEKGLISKNTHPTLKPINLMTYLCRLVTPEGGIVLDPFMGSGSTGISALLEGFRFIGMEQDKSYFDIASARIEAYEDYRKLLK